MVDAVLRRSRRRDYARMAAAALDYAAMGWPVCTGAYLPDSSRRSQHGRGRSQGTGRACSCDRIGCPAPGAHPVSPAWQLEATADPDEVARWWAERPGSNVILVTGRVFDVLDVPAAAGSVALSMLDSAGSRPGPVALSAGGRALFFVATRGAPDDEGEWWSCHLDCEPDSVAQVAGLRWHTRNSFVLAPPSPYGRGLAAHWIRTPREHSLPDALRLLDVLADACDEVAG
jgi:Bifunctional DNA primase/polymerase, N-terminal